jgi:hypothetical protein
MGVLYQARDTEQRREGRAEGALTRAARGFRVPRPVSARKRSPVACSTATSCGFLEAGEDGDVPFIAMEFLRGTTLAERLNLGPPLSLRAKLDVVIQSVRRAAVSARARHRAP